MPETFLNYIGGKWVPARSGRTFENINPADVRDVIGLFPRSDESDVNEAVTAAKKAFPAWSTTPAPERAEILRRVGEKLIQKKWEIARELTREMGKILKEAGGDVQEAIDTALYISGEGRRMFGVVTPSELQNKWAMAFRRPVGICAIITPWNFPTALPMWKIAPALVCGNTVVFKPSSFTPKTANLLVQVFEECGLPPGVLNLVHGLGSEVGDALVQHPDVRLISFTGSTETGRRINELAARQLKKISLEMGGKNAIIVMDDADVDLAVEGILWGAFGTTGQRCTATSRLIVHEKIYDQVVNLLKNRTEKLVVGNGLNPGVDVGPVINQDQLNKIHHYVTIGVQEGAKLITGGKILSEGDFQYGFFYAPTLFEEVLPHMTLFQEEIFGPVLSISRVSSLEQAIEYVNQSRYGLSSAIYTRDLRNAFVAMEHIEAGITYINAPTIGSEVHLPFGGVKETGNGHREGAAWTLLEIFSEWKTVYVDYSGKLQKAQKID
ncbi:MAG: aldehyde dehydrogenase family protein [bacterium JZ-2024 1]